MDFATDPQIWISLLTLTALEIVLGIDNIIFISILSGKLPAEEQPKARQLGLSLALITRILLDERVRTGAISMRVFYIRRALRIFPIGTIPTENRFFLVGDPGDTVSVCTTGRRADAGR